MTLIDKLRRIDCTHGDAMKAAITLELCKKILENLDYQTIDGPCGPICRICRGPLINRHEGGTTRKYVIHSPSCDYVAAIRMIEGKEVRPELGR